MRVVSLLPSATEMVAFLGLAGNLVGRSHECDFPAAVRRVPSLTASKVERGLGSAKIEERVQEIIRQGLSVYEVDASLLRNLAPDLILTQSQCAVCAVTPGDLEQALGAWTGQAPRLLSLAPASLGEVWHDLLQVGNVLGAQAEALRKLAGLQDRMEELRRRTAAIGKRPKLAAIEWIEPLMVAGNWVPELVEIAGGTSLLARSGEHSPWIDWEVLEASDPDLILIIPCGFSIERSLVDLERLQDRPAWQKLRAVREGKFFIADGRQFFSRPGPRLVESAEILAEILHPSIFDFGHRGRSWIKAGGPGCNA